ncbi:MAG: hypothetical protein IJF79_01975 [Clostridia bacterium]|nr:hypothetical protein [Clostridia bacterium]
MMMDENKLDQLIEENITEARTLWLDTLPHKEDIPRHRFTTGFRLKIRKMAGMKYTLLYFLKLVGVGVISMFLGYMPMFFTIMPMFPLLLISSTETSMIKMAGLASVFAAVIAVYFLKHLWRWLGEWSRSREMGSHWMTVAVTMGLPALMATAHAIGQAIRLPDWVGENTIYQMFEGGIGPVRMLAGYSIFKDIFFGDGALIWLLVYTAIFYAGNREIDLKPIWRPLFAMGWMAGVYEALIVLQMPHLLVWFKLGYLLALVWMFWGLGAVLKLQKRHRTILLAVGLTVAVLLMFADLSDVDEIEPRAMPLFARTMKDVFPDMEGASVAMRFNGGKVKLDAAQAEEVRDLLSGIDLRPLQETDSGLIGTWRGPIRITVEVADVENPCTVTLAEIAPELHGSADRIYRLGFAFDNGEAYAYTGDDAAQLPLEALAALVRGKVQEEAPGPTVTFTFDLSGLEGEYYLKQDMILSTTWDGGTPLAFNGILEKDRYICIVPIEEDVEYLYLHEPIFSILTVRDGKAYWDEYIPTSYTVDTEADVKIFSLSAD